MTVVEKYVKHFYLRYRGRIPLAAGISTDLDNVVPMVFEDTSGLPIGIVAMAANSNFGDNAVQIYLLSVFKHHSGYGSQILSNLCDEADTRRFHLHAQAESQYISDDDFIPRDKLVSWYQSFGFIGNYMLERLPKTT